MECNKEEALRAKSIAENKIANKDFAGARKIALKAQELFPALDGISLMLRTIDVYISAETKVGGEADWYGVLGLDPSVDDEAMKKQYRKLALMLHPDKNKSVGADGAVALILEAYGLLSDKSKRMAYDQRMGFSVFQQRVPMSTGVPSPSASQPSTGSSVSGKTTSETTPPASRSAPTPAPAPSFQRTNTFWSTCHFCNVQYEHLKTHLNPSLLCDKCMLPFMDLATPRPQNYPKSSAQVPEQPQCNSSNHAPNQTQAPVAGQAGHRDANDQQGPLPGWTDPSIGATPVHMDHEAQDKLNRAFAESSPKDGNFKKRKTEDYISPFGVSSNLGPGSRGFGNANSSASGSGSRCDGVTGFSDYSSLRTNEARGNSVGTSDKEHPKVNTKN